MVEASQKDVFCLAGRMNLNRSVSFFGLCPCRSKTVHRLTSQCLAVMLTRRNSLYRSSCRSGVAAVAAAVDADVAGPSTAEMFEMLFRLLHWNLSDSQTTGDLHSLIANKAQSAGFACLYEYSAHRLRRQVN